MKSHPLALALVFLGTPATASGAETYRGNVQRTGSDGSAGPKAPTVLWVQRGQEHFIAAPVASGDQVYVSGLGAFNVATFYSLALDPKAGRRVTWSKSTPYLRLPVVSSPAVSGGHLYFGDGMHQTDGARLHGLRVQGGLPLWQLELPGRLVHLEGTPAAAGGRLYSGGGAAGVLCVDPQRLTLDGRERDAAAIQKILEEKWKELLARYEVEKKKDPDFAVPPTEDQLPRPAPRVVWRQGQGRWHVDAPVAVVGGNVLVASAFLDQEQVGDRALYCLDAATGSIRWRAPLTINPWGGPSVLGEAVVVGGSTIGYDTKALPKARGAVAAYNLADGKERWRKEVPGGVLSCVALDGGLAVAAATDGKVRAFELATGERRWVYDAKAPVFAAPAVSSGAVFVGDLRGVVHAVGLADGAARWTLDVGNHPGVKAPGMIYGGPVLHRGRLVVATCNLEGPNANKPTAVVCLGDP